MKTIKLIATFCLLLTACNTAKTRQSLQQIPAELLGSFKDDYGSTYTITNKEWKHGKSTKYHLLRYNREGSFFIAKNDDANPSDKGLYTRIDIVFF